MNALAAVIAALLCGVAYCSGVRSGTRETRKRMHGSIIHFVFSNPGISEKRINEIASSLISSEGDMHAQAVNHIRQAAQEAIGVKEQS